MKRILLHLDSDAHPSSFDAITAIDGGAECLLSHGNVTSTNVVGLVHGTIFTRAPRALKNTAIFIGGSRVDAGEEILKTTLNSFFGPMRVSVMMDSNGCNTTASAAVIYAHQELNLAESQALVLGATGPVGSRVVKLLLKQGCKVKVASRSLSRAESLCAILGREGQAEQLIPAQVSGKPELGELLEGVNLVVAAGAAGATFCQLEELVNSPQMRVAIDLNAVPPLGINGIESGDKARKVGELSCYGALGVGGFKMKLHHHLIGQLFESNTEVFDTEAIFEAGLKMASSGGLGR